MKPRRHARLRMRSHHWLAFERFLLGRRHLALSTARKTIGFARLMEHGGVPLLRPSRERYDEFVARLKQRGRDAPGPGLIHYGAAMKHVLAWRGVSWPDFRVERIATSARRLLPDATVAQFVEFELGRDEEENETARFCFNVGFYLALRPPSEFHALDLADYDRKSRELRVWSEKLQSYETMKVAPWLHKELVRYIDGLRARVAKRGERALIVDPWTGRAFATPAALRMFVKRCGQRIVEDFTPYDMRHWSACWVLRRTGYNVYLTKVHLRQRKLASAEHYLHILRAEENRELLRRRLRPVRRNRKSAPRT